MNARAAAQPKRTFTSRVEPTPGVLFQRKCACGNHAIGGGECDACTRNKESLQRKSVIEGALGEVPPIVHDVLRSPGKPLDATTRAYMEPRFGRDFSQVRVHSDAMAAKSARPVHALAYTAALHLAFGTGQYAPTTNPCRN